VSAGAVAASQELGLPRENDLLWLQARLWLGQGNTA
jgi:hypothetical protein